MSTDQTIVEAAAVAEKQPVEAAKPPAAVVDAGKAKEAPAASSDAAKGAPAAKTAVDATDDRAATSGTLPDNWRELVAGSADEAKKLERFGSPKALWESYQEAQKKIREKTTTLTPPGADATPEQVKAWREANGIPESPDKYEIKLADDRQLGDADKPIVEAFAPVAHELGLNQTQLSRIVDWQLRRQEEDAAAQMEADEENKSTGRSSLREEWGPADFKRNMGAIGELMGRASGEVELGDGSKLALSDAILTARLANGRLLGNEPAAVKFLAGLGLDLVPLDSQLPPGHSEGSVTSRLEEIRAIRRTDIDKYNADKGLQAEERKLLEIDAKAKERNKRAA